MRSSIATTRVGGKVRINLGTKEVETAADEDHVSEIDIKTSQSKVQGENERIKEEDLKKNDNDNDNVRLVIEERNDNDGDILYVQKVVYDCIVYICGDKMKKYLTLTRETLSLTIAQREFYEKNGYIIFPRLISSEVLEKCAKRFDDIAEGKVDRGMMTVMRDIVDRRAVNKVQDINHDQIFRSYIEDKKILDIVEAFTGPNIMAMHSMLIAKPPDSGFNSSRHPPHQDLYYFPFRPANSIIAAWTAVEPCHTSNGCLFVSPGSHIPQKLYPHGYPKDKNATNKFYHGIHDLPKSMVWIDLEMEPGDTVFFHPLLVHGSGVNKSNRTRKAISCHYASAECQYIDVRGTVQEPIRNEILELVKKRYPTADIEYNDVWRMKSSLVRGIRSSL